MEEMETYSIACWDDSSGAVEGEEVICGMDNDGAILVDNEEFEGGVCEEVVVQDEEAQEGDVMYIEDDGNNMIVMQQSEETAEVIDCLKEGRMYAKYAATREVMNTWKIVKSPKR